MMKMTFEVEEQFAFWSCRSDIEETGNCPRWKKYEPLAIECYWKSAHDFDGGGTFALCIIVLHAC